jgi:hypothetical protein
MTTKTAAPKATPKQRATSAPAKVAAPKHTFKPGTCHHRAATGTPNCAKKIVGTSANLCPAHQAAWSLVAKKRAADAKAPKANVRHADAKTTNVDVVKIKGVGALIVAPKAKTAAKTRSHAPHVETIPSQIAGTVQDPARFNALVGPVAPAFA